jgi:phosphatidylglycerophosphate synthase
MRASMTAVVPMLFVPVGTNAARVFGLDARERACRLASSSGFECADEVLPGRAALVASMAYAWDPAWLQAMRDRPRSVLMLDEKPVMAHILADTDAVPIMEAMQSGRPLQGYDALDAWTVEVARELRKRGRPFVLPFEVANGGPIERAAYDAADKGTSDILTLYLWRTAGFHLTRWAARARLSPNLITLVGAALCVLAFILFWRTQYWWGICAAFIFMVLDTVDGTFARVTVSFSKWGEVFDHGIDFIHPPFWYWAWEHGLAAYGCPLAPLTATMMLSAIIGGYAGQRIIEGLFITRFGGMPMHVWKELDTKFSLITARRNPNMIILTGSLLFRRPDAGLALATWWTIASLIFHAVRLAQATEQAARGAPITSWLDA